MTASIYLAGPIQHAADHGKGWRQRLKDGDIGPDADVEFIDPLDSYNTHEMEYKEWNSEDVIQEDLEIIADCDAVLVHWLEVPTCGTPMEVFFSNYFPKMASMIEGLAGNITAPEGVSEEDLIVAEAEAAGLEDWMVGCLLAMNNEIPVVVQTNVPAEELSPWLTGHADVIVGSFDDSINWIDAEVNGGEVEVDEIEPEYELIEAQD